MTARNNLRDQLIKSTGGTFFLKLCASALSFTVTLFLTKALGKESYGTYVYVLAWIGVLSIPATIGFTQIVVRDIAIYYAKKEWALLRGLLSFSNKIVFLSSLTTMLVAMLACWLFVDDGVTGSIALPFYIALISLPFIALTQIAQATMRGFMCIVRGQLSEFIVRPIILLLLLLAAVVFYDGVTVSQALLFNLVAVVVAFLVSFKWARMVSPVEAGSGGMAFHKTAWLGAASPMLITSGIQMINFQADIIILGFFDESSQLGVYSVTKQITGLITFGLMAVEISFAPTIARLYSAGLMSKLQEIISKGSAAMLFISIPLVVLLVFFGEDVLVIFGKDFVEGKNSLLILAAGQLINVFFGPVGQIAIHTGHGKRSMYIIGLGAFLNIVLNLLLIPQWGIIGAALAATISLASWNIILAIYIFRKTGVISGAFALIKKNKRIKS